MAATDPQEFLPGCGGANPVVYRAPSNIDLTVHGPLSRGERRVEFIPDDLFLALEGRRLPVLCGITQTSRSGPRLDISFLGLPTNDPQRFLPIPTQGVDVSLGNGSVWAKGVSTAEFTGAAMSYGLAERTVSLKGVWLMFTPHQANSLRPSFIYLATASHRASLACSREGVARLSRV